MSSLSCLLVLLMVTYLEATSSISRTPKPVPGFEQDKTLGQWFITYVYNPCSKGDRRNQNAVFSFVGKNALKLKVSWQQDGFCNAVTMKKVMVSPGVYLLEDGVGDVFSSTSIVVTTDYTRSYILWVCDKYNAFGDLCEKPYFLILTRSPQPDAKTIGMVNASLKSIWGFTINDIRKVVQTGECYGGKKSLSFYKGK